MSTPADIEGLLRQLAPRALGAVVRRYGRFADAEDAVQDAMVTAATSWAADGLPDQPLAWLIRVAARRMVDRSRTDEARRRREVIATSWSAAGPEPAPAHDDTLILFFMSCHPALSAASAIALTLRAIGGLTTRQIAAAFLVPEPTMAQRISRAKATVAASGQRFALPTPSELPTRLHSVLHVLYLLYNEGYATSAGPDLVRVDLSAEAIRLARLLHGTLPDDPEATALLALMLLNDARRPARTDALGQLIPLAEQDRSRWDHGAITEGLVLLTAAMRHGAMGAYQSQAAIAALHDQAATYEDTDWARIVALYDVVAGLTPGPIVSLNRAVAVAMVEGPQAGLDILEGLQPELDGHHRFHAVRAHLLESADQLEEARAEYVQAAARTDSLQERHYLTVRAGRLANRV